MARTRSTASIDIEIQKITDELIKVQNKKDALEAKLLELQKKKKEQEAKQIMDAFQKSGKSLQELMIFLDV
jgi:seryl-tRNA synthetase